MRVRRGQHHHGLGSSWSGGWVLLANLCHWKTTRSLYSWSIIFAIVTSLACNSPLSLQSFIPFKIINYWDLFKDRAFLWFSYKESACNAKDVDLIPGWGESPGGGHGNPLQYSCQENPMDCWAIVHEVAKSLTQLKPLSTFKNYHCGPA